MAAKEDDEMIEMFELSVDVGGVSYSVVVGDGREPYDGAPMVSISRAGVWVGAGWWGGQRIEDCAAVLGEDVYAALDAAIVAADAHPARYVGQGGVTLCGDLLRPGTRRLCGGCANEWAFQGGSEPPGCGAQLEVDVGSV